jgi:hypothetical protein
MANLAHGNDPQAEKPQTTPSNGQQQLALGTALATTGLILALSGVAILFLIPSRIWSVQFVAAVVTIWCAHAARSHLRKAGMPTAAAGMTRLTRMLGYPVLMVCIWMLFVTVLSPRLPFIAAIF